MRKLFFNTLTVSAQINVQLGLNNLSTITSHLSMVTKADLPTSKYLKMSRRLREIPVLAFAENKTLFFCGQYQT